MRREAQQFGNLRIDPCQRMRKRHFIDHAELCTLGDRGKAGAAVALLVHHQNQSAIEGRSVKCARRMRHMMARSNDAARTSARHPIKNSKIIELAPKRSPVERRQAFRGALATATLETSPQPMPARSKQ